MSSSSEPLVYRKDHLATRNADPGTQVYGEDLFSINGVEYRRWHPKRSKLAATLLSRHLPLPAEDGTILDLGAASGTTTSHLCDLVPQGRVVAVESAPVVARRLIRLASRRPNLIPVHNDAREPERYAHLIEARPWLVQDISQRDQVTIFVRNLRTFEPQGALLLLKARSLNSRVQPSVVFREVEKQLTRELGPPERISLKRYYPDHCAFWYRSV